MEKRKIDDPAHHHDKFYLGAGVLATITNAMLAYMITILSMQRFETERMGEQAIDWSLYLSFGMIAMILVSLGVALRLKRWPKGIPYLLLGANVILGIYVLIIKYGITQWFM